MARCAEMSNAAFPLRSVSFTEPGAREPSRRMMNVTTAGGTETRVSKPEVFQLRATAFRRRFAYAPNWVPNTESLPSCSPPPPWMLYIGELVFWPPSVYNWLGRSCCWSRNLFGADDCALSVDFLVARGFLIAMASGSGAFTLGAGFFLEGGSGTCDSVSFATGLKAADSCGSLIEATGVIATEPIPPPCGSPHCTVE